MSLTPQAPQNPWRSALVSAGFTAWTIVAMVFSFALADSAMASPQAFLAWASTHWWTVLVGLIINPAPYYRAQQAITNAQKGIVS